MRRLLVTDEALGVLSTLLEEWDSKLDEALELTIEDTQTLETLDDLMIATGGIEELRQIVTELEQAIQGAEHV